MARKLCVTFVDVGDELRKRAMHLGMLATGVASGLCAGLPARADTVFSSYTGVDGADMNATFNTTGPAAEAFTPTANFDFTGAAAYVSINGDVPPAQIVFSLYSAAADLPDVKL